MEVESMSFKTYTERFYSGLPADFRYQNGPVQLYDLAQVAPFIKRPTELVKAEFSFMVHLTAGYFEQQVGNEIKRVNASSILFAGHGQITSLLKSSDEVSGFFVFFDDHTLNEMVAGKKELLKLFVANPLIPLDEKDSDWVDKALRLLYTEATAASPDADVCVALCQSTLYKVASAAEISKTYDRANDIAIRFRELAYRHFVDEKQVGFYSEALHVSENYLYRCVKQVLGKSPKHLLSEIAVVRSQLLLKDFTKSVAEVAYSLNFDDPSYFGRIFKQVFGFTPTDYRNCIAQDLSDRDD